MAKEKMKNICISIVFILNFCLSGCINFNPKGKETGTKKESIADNPKDDAIMENSTHLKFKGVPIDGKLEEFVSRMKRKGFRHVASQNEGDILQGDFADFKDCTIYVSTLDNKDLVSRISVAFPDQEQWEYLYGDYKHLKELLIEKYGKPSACTERFNRTEPHDDRSKMYEVKFDNCNYETRFETNNGEIILWIEHDEVSSCFVMLAYKDKENCNVIRQHAKDDL